MKWRAETLTALVLWFLPGALCAGDFRVITHPYADLTVLAFGQGRDGFLWLAAPDGLHRFDGLNLTRIPGFPGGYPRSMALGGDGALWLATGQSLVRFDGKFSVPHEGGVIDVVAGGSDVYFIEDIPGENRYRIFRRDSGGLIRMLDLHGGTRLHLDSSGTLWYASLDGRVFQYVNGGSVPEYLGTTRPESVSYLKVVPGVEGTVWCGVGA